MQVTGSIYAGYIYAGYQYVRVVQGLSEGAGMVRK